MFIEKELESVKDMEDLCAQRIDDALKSKKGSDADYIQNLQTLFILKDAANKKIQRIKDR